MVYEKSSRALFREQMVSQAPPLPLPASLTSHHFAPGQGDGPTTLAGRRNTKSCCPRNTSSISGSGKFWEGAGTVNSRGSLTPIFLKPWRFCTATALFNSSFFTSQKLGTRRHYGPPGILGKGTLGQV